MFHTLDDSNFTLFAAKYYANPNCESQQEFEDDINRIKYIKRLLKKYKNGGELRERLILNHLIILYNVFHHKACTRMLCFKLRKYLEQLKPFLLYLNYWPENVDPIGTNKEVIIDSNVAIDMNIVKALREI